MSSAQSGPSADEVKERIDSSQANLGAGEEEADPATAANPPADRQEGDKQRNPD